MRIQTIRRKLLFCVFAALFGFTFVASSGYGTLLTDDFNSYTDGNLAGQGPWTAHSGAGVIPVQVVSGEVVLAQGSGTREDVNAPFAGGAVMGAGAVWTSSFDVTVSGVDPATTTYFAHFRDGGTGFNSRVFVTAPNVGEAGEFTFGIGETSSSTPAAIYGVNFDYGTTYDVTVSYNFDTGISNLTVGSAGTIDSTSQADPGEDIQTWAWRQSGGNTSMVVDNLVVVPEPSTAVFVLFGLMGMFLIRRR